MKYINKHFEQQGVSLQATVFANEYHVVLHLEPSQQPFHQQLQRLYAIEDLLPTLPEFSGAQYVMKRYFLSDSTNQVPLMRQEKDIAISFIQQQPLDGTKVAVWMYLQSGVQITTENNMVVSSHNGYKHLWEMGMCSPHGDSATQTDAILREYEEQLNRFGATLERNCLRTWFFVRDVDTQYAGMVTARRENFELLGLTHNTHYIASTGIQGGPANTKALIQMGAYSIAGSSWNPQQQRYLYAPTHLNPTYEYGVTFERGVCVEYGDRAHTIISGTASINNKGEVMHVGDIVRQTERMWENVETLLMEADMNYDDVMHLIVYLRDTADYDVVKKMFDSRFPHIPTIISLAPVCRPTWLIEMECIAIKSRHNAQYPDF